MGGEIKVTNLGHLEEEMKLLKGEIKKILIDIREIMNNLENPFRNMEVIKEMIMSDERIEVWKKDIYKKIKEGYIKPEVDLDRFKEEILEKIEEEAKARLKEVVKDAQVKEISPEALEAVKEEIINELTESLEKFVEERLNAAMEQVRADVSSAEELKEEIERARERLKKEVGRDLSHEEERASPTREERMAILRGRALESGIDVQKLTELMLWTDRMLSIIGREQLSRILEIYTLTGNMPESVKELILKISELSDKTPKREVSMRDCILAVYHLNKVLRDEGPDPLILSMLEWGE